MSTFGENLKKIRIKKGLSQKELASLMGYKGGKATISRIENGHNGVTQATVVKFCEVLNVSPLDLLRNPKTDVLSEHEKELISAYRKQEPAVQAAIDRLLGIEKKISASGSKVS